MFSHRYYNLQRISLKIYDVQGREVAVVVDGSWRTARWSAACPEGAARRISGRRENSCAALSISH